ncbi:MAG TPA: ROK family protein [Acidimicrobiales bacterium]|nr:ROK family protein [Acidimicrobiales bacterium]
MSDAGAVTLGIDVGGTKMLGLALGPDDAVLAEARVPTPQQDAAALLGAIASLARTLQGLLEEEALAPALALGVGVPGLVDADGVLRFAPNLPAGTGLAMAARLSGDLGMVTVVENDATCAADAECHDGAATGVEEALVVTLGTGIGGGVVSGGQVRRGAHGFAGEIGHMVVDPSGPLCSCGKRGCWERYASGSGLARLAREAAQAGRLQRVVQLAGGDPESVRGEHVSTAAAAGDAEAVAVLDELAWWIALGLANVVLVLDPEVIVIGGGLVDAMGPLLGPVRVQVGAMVDPDGHRPSLRIVPAALGERAGAVGAALAARREATCTSG